MIRPSGHIGTRVSGTNLYGCEETEWDNSGEGHATDCSPHRFRPLRFWDAFLEEGLCRCCVLPRHAHPIHCWMTARSIGDTRRYKWGTVLRSRLDAAKDEATSLLDSLWPELEKLNSGSGMITQINNGVAGLHESLATVTAQRDRLIERLESVICANKWR